jgi:hypothetical protein
MLILLRIFTSQIFIKINYYIIYRDKINVCVQAKYTKTYFSAYQYISDLKVN